MTVISTAFTVGWELVVSVPVSMLIWAKHWPASVKPHETVTDDVVNEVELNSDDTMNVSTYVPDGMELLLSKVIWST